MKTPGCRGVRDVAVEQGRPGVSIRVDVAEHVWILGTRAEEDVDASDRLPSRVHRAVFFFEEAWPQRALHYQGKKNRCHG